MSKLCQTFHSSYKSSQASILFHTASFPLSECCDSYDCGQISKKIFFFLNPVMQKICFDKNQWFQLLSAKNHLIISLFLISITLNTDIAYLLAIPSCLLSVWKNTIFDFRWKLCCYSSPSHLTPENCVSWLALCLSFVFFVFFFWSIETTTANLQGLTHSNPCKTY